MSKISNSFIWSAVDHFSVQAIQIILSIIIARLVAPSAYGVIVMVQVFVSFAQLFIDGGFKNALIQKRDRKEIDFYTMFIFNIAVALFFYLVLFFAAPSIADFYNEPILTDLTRVVGLSMVFSSLSIIQLTRLQINLDFKTQAKARVTSIFISGSVGVYCAYNGMEVWALVIQGVVSSLVTTIMLCVYSRWIPRWQFSMESFKHMASFGSKILFGNILTTFYIQITNLIIGKVYTSTQLAYYNRAFYLSQLPSASISEVISRTVLPIYCSLQENKEALIASYNKYTRMSCIIIFPLLALVCVLSKPLTTVLLTEKWVDMAPLLSIFCLVFIFYPLFLNGGQVVLSVGHAGLLAKAVMVKRAIAFSALIIALPISVTAVAWGLVFSNFMEMIISMYCVRKTLQFAIRAQFAIIVDITLLTALSATIAWLASLLPSSDFLRLCFGVAVGLAVYVSGFYIFRIKERQYLNQIITKLISG